MCARGKLLVHFGCVPYWEKVGETEEGAKVVAVLLEAEEKNGSELRWPPSSLPSILPPPRWG